jgi:tRNA nucleotidyltransferase/poly(A) polymerase
MLKERVPAFILFILTRLRAFNHQAYIVGGAVRDALLGRPILDWDVTTSASPDCVAEVFRDLRQVRFKGGTTVLVSDGHHHEVTSFRGADGSIEGDLAGRDFTIDAMAYDDLRDGILDPFHGREDLLKRKIKAVGEARVRFEEDPLRILRAVRLAAELLFSIDSATASVMSGMSPCLEKVAPERIREEVVKILVTSKPSTGLRQMARLGILEAIVPELLECRAVRLSARHRHQSLLDHLLETLDRVEATPHLRLAALFHDAAKPRVKKKVSGRWQFPDHAEASALMVEEIMRRLKFSRKMIAQTSMLARYHHFGHPMEEDSDIIDWLQRVGPDRCHDLIALRRADLLARGLHTKIGTLNRVEAKVAALIKTRMVLTPADLAVDGQSVMKTLGLLPGPQVGKILRALMAYANAHPSLNNEEALTALLLEMKGRDGGNSGRNDTRIA